MLRLGERDLGRGVFKMNSQVKSSGTSFDWITFVGVNRFTVYLYSDEISRGPFFDFYHKILVPR